MEAFEWKLVLSRNYTRIRIQLLHLLITSVVSGIKLDFAMRYFSIDFSIENKEGVGRLIVL